MAQYAARSPHSDRRSTSQSLCRQGISAQLNKIQKPSDRGDYAPRKSALSGWLEILRGIWSGGIGLAWWP
jgi:hypothetical protein